jgi:hypothetical protein
METPDFLKRSEKRRAEFDSQRLTDEGQIYFDQVLAEYDLIIPPVQPDAVETAIRKIADAIRAKPRLERTYADLLSLEIAVNKLRSEADLRREAWAVRTRYRDLAGDKAYEVYQASNPPDPRLAPVEELRSDILQIINEFHWIYAFAPLREKTRSRLLKSVFWTTVAMVVLALGLATVAYFRLSPAKQPAISSSKSSNGHSQPGESRTLPILPIVLAMGMIGGYISLQQRIQGIPSSGDPILNIAELSDSVFSVYLSPVSGAVFAAMIYIIFIAKLLVGPLFPVIASPPIHCDGNSSQTSGSNQSVVAGALPSSTAKATDLEANGSSSTDQPKDKCPSSVDFSTFVNETGPATGMDFALLLFWAFVAGFAERLVPDTIDRLVNQATTKS